MPSLATLPRDLGLFAKYHLVRRAEKFPAPETELGVVPLGFDLDAYVAELRAFEGPRFAVETEASVSFGGRPHPILTIRTRAPAARTLLVLAGVHGNEHAGLLAVPQILEAWAPARELGLVVMSPVNPIGAAEVSRYNGEGYDVNRDFVRFDTPEARAVRDVYARVRPDFVVSLHEGPQDASFLFVNRYVEPSLVRKVLCDLEEGGTVLAERDYFGSRLRPRGLSPRTRAGILVHRLWAATLSMKATLSYSEDLGIPEIVLESSWRLPDREARIRAHVDLVASLARSL